MITTDRLVEDYLDRLEEELADMPRERRRELVSEIAAHIDEGRREARTEAEVLTLLDRLGEPAEIADEARDRSASFPRFQRAGRARWRSAPCSRSARVVFLPVAGPLVGLTLVWISNVWRMSDKVVATVVVGCASGLVALAIAAGAAVGPLEFAIVALAPLIATAYLGIRLRSL